MKPKRRLRNLTVKEVALVRAGDNPPARISLFKARPDGDADDDPEPGRLRQLLSAVRKRLRGGDAQRAERRLLAELEKAEAAADAAEEALAAALEGDDPADDDDEPEDPEGSDKKEDPPVKKTYAQILAALPEEERGVVAAELAGRDAEIAKLKPKDPPPDPMAALPAEFRKQLEDERAERAELKKQVEALRGAGERAAFAKTLEPLNHLPTKTDDLVGLLFDLPAEKRTALVGVLKASDALIARGGLGALGSERDGAAGSALAKIDAAAQEIRKAKPELSIEKARTLAMEQNPALYEEAEAERRQGLLH